MFNETVTVTPSLSRGRGRAARASHLDSDRNQRLRVAPRHPSARSLGELASPRGHEPGHGLAARLARTAVHLSPKQSKHSKCKLTRRAASVRNAPCAPPPHPLAWHYPHVRVIFGASGAPRAEAWILRRTSAACGRGCDSAPQCFGPPSHDVGKSGSRHRQLRCPAQKGRGLTQHRRGMPAEAIESEHHQAAGFGLRTAAAGGGAAASAAAAALHDRSVPAKRTATGDATSCSATP